MKTGKIVGMALIAVALLLLTVGIESGTLNRHLIQIIPMVTLAPVVFREKEHGLPAALGVLLFWLAIMVLIWLHILNVVHVVQGKFTTVEIVLTVLIAMAATVGIFKVFRVGVRTSYFHFFLFFTCLFYAYGFLSLSYERFLFID